MKQNNVKYLVYKKLCNLIDWLGAKTIDSCPLKKATVAFIMTNVTVRMSRFLMPTAFKGSNHLTSQLLGQNCANLRTAVIVIRGSHTSLLHQQSGHLSTAPPSLLLQQISHKQHFHSASSSFQDSKSGMLSDCSPKSFLISLS